MRRTLRIPIPPQEALWNGIDRSLGLLVFDSDGSILDERVLDPFREATRLGGATVVIVGSPGASIESESEVLGGSESASIAGFHLHFVARPPELTVLASLKGDSVFLLRTPVPTVKDLAVEITGGIHARTRFIEPPERGKIINFAQLWGPIVSVLDEGSSLAYYGLPSEIESIAKTLELHRNA